VVDIATSPLTEYSDLGKTLKGGDQQEGESRLDVAGDAENGHRWVISATPRLCNV
jgi:hypothetical protein